MELTSRILFCGAKVVEIMTTGHVTGVFLGHRILSSGVRLAFYAGNLIPVPRRIKFYLIFLDSLANFLAFLSNLTKFDQKLIKERANLAKFI